MMKNIKDFSGLSLPRSVEVLGFKIKRMPIGAFLCAVQRLEGMSADVLDGVFEGRNLFEFIKNADSEDVKTLVGRALSIAPEYLLSFISDLSGIEYIRLVNDERIGLYGLLEIVRAIYEVNRLGEFINGVTALWRETAGDKRTGGTGSKI